MFYGLSRRALVCACASRLSASHKIQHVNRALFTHARTNANQQTNESSSPSSSPASSSNPSSSTDSSATGSGGQPSAAKASPPFSSYSPSLMQKLSQELLYVKEYLASKRAPIRASPRRIRLNVGSLSKRPITDAEWSQESVDRKNENDKQTKEGGDANNGGDELKEAKYEGPTDLVLQQKELVWERRIQAARELLRSNFLWRSVRRGSRALEQSENPLAQKIVTAKKQISEEVEDFKDNWENSQDPRVWKMRDAADKVFGETEMGYALGEIMRCDPSFQLHEFLQELEEYMIPIVIEAFRKGDMKLLISIVDGQARHAMFASFRERATQKVDWDDRTLDIRGLDLVKATVIDDTPILVVSFVGQHVHCHRDVATGEVKAGSESDIQNVYYSWTLRRDFDNPYFDWKILEFQYHHIQSLV